MARKVTRKSLKHDEFVEAAFDFEHWLEQHWRQVAAIAGGVVALALIVWGVSLWQRRSAGETERLLAEGLSKIHPDPSAPMLSSDPAVRYTAALPAFEQAARRSGSKTPAGRVATFYQAASLQKLGRAPEAIAILEPLAAASGEEDLFSDLVRAKLGWLYADTGQTDKSVSTWKDLAARTDGYFPGDEALLNAALILVGAGRTEEAKAAVQDLMAKYPQGAASQEAAKLLAKVSGVSPAPAP